MRPSSAESLTVVQLHEAPASVLVQCFCAFRRPRTVSADSVCVRTVGNIGSAFGLESARDRVACGSRSRHVPDSQRQEENHILSALPAGERERLFPHLQRVEMPLGAVVYESGDTLRHMYFPTDCIVSLLYVLENGASAEIAVVGNEGAIGVALFMGGETTPSRAIVQSAGFAYRLAGKRIKEEFDRHGQMLHVLLRYTQSLHHADGPDRGLQPASLGGSAALPLVAAVARPPVFEQTHDDAGADRQHARRAPRRRHRGRRQVAEARCDQLQPRQDHGAQPAASSSSSPASATPWSREKPTGCSLPA